jgi:nickel/cobalt transporter (NiCoT) family protein
MSVPSSWARMMSAQRAVRAHLSSSPPRGLTRSVRHAWQIYPIGVLFGLGFDTATEVGLLVLAGGAAAFNLPFYSILVLAILFAAGMCLMDTIDGVFMNAAYGWAFAKPVRKVFYSITITSISVAVALIIGARADRRAR